MRTETKCVCGDQLIAEGSYNACATATATFMDDHMNCQAKAQQPVTAIPKEPKRDPVPPPLPKPEPRPCQSHGGTFKGELYNIKHHILCPRCIDEFCAKSEFTNQYCVPPPFDRSSTDAQVWAKEFIRLNANTIVSANSGPDKLDDATMLAWFANAMCAQMDADNTKHAREKQQMLDGARIKANILNQQTERLSAQINGLNAKINELAKDNTLLAEMVREQGEKEAATEMALSDSRAMRNHFERESEVLHTSGIVEIAAVNPRVAEFVSDLEKRVAKAEQKAAQYLKNLNNTTSVHDTEIHRIDAALNHPRSGATLLESDLAEIARILALLDTRNDEVQSLMSQLAQYRDAQQPKQDTP